MLLRLAVGVIVAYGGIVGVMYLTLADVRARYRPLSPVAAGLPQAEELTVSSWSPGTLRRDPTAR